MDGLKLALCSAFIFVLVSNSIAEEIRRDLSLDFDPIEGAISYDIEVRSKTNLKRKEAKVFTSLSPTWKAKMAPGIYQIRLRAIDERSVPGEWSEPSSIEVLMAPLTPLFPTEELEIQSNEELEYDVPFKWSPVEDVKYYTLSIFTKLSDDKVEIFKSIETTESAYSLKLPVATEYFWQVEAIKRNGMRTSLDKKKLSFKINGAKLRTPVFNEPQIDSQKSTAKNLVSLSWQKIEFANSYELSLKIKKNDSWAPTAQTFIIKNNTRYKFLVPDGVFKANLMAQSLLRPASQSDDLYFEIRNGKIIAMGLNENALIERRLYQKKYGYLVYLQNLSASFEGYNSYHNSHAQFKDAEGVGLTVGLQAQELYRRFGLLTTLSYKTFDLQSARNSITVETINGEFYISRPIFQNQTAQFNLYGGLFYEEIPEVLGSARNNQLAVQFLQTSGLGLGINWLKKISTRWDFDFYISLRKSLFDVAVPEGKKNQNPINASVDIRFKYLLKSERSIIFGINSGNSGEYKYPGSSFTYDNGGIYLGGMF